jgi:hypothetical protein
MKSSVALLVCTGVLFAGAVRAQDCQMFEYINAPQLTSTPPVAIATGQSTAYTVRLSTPQQSLVVTQAPCLGYYVPISPASAVSLTVRTKPGSGSPAFTQSQSSLSLDVLHTVSIGPLNTAGVYTFEVGGDAGGNFHWVTIGQVAVSATLPPPEPRVYLPPILDLLLD